MTIDADIAAIRDALAAAKKEAPPWARLEQAAEFWCVANPERIARLLDALEAAQKDAARYRWVRQADNAHMDFILYEAETVSDVDAAIDAAMKEKP